MSELRLLEVRDSPLSVDELLAVVADRSAGGTCVFIGTVRDHDHGVSVEALSYSAHPTAVDRLRDVAGRIAAEEDVIALAAVHRTGDLVVGDLAVVVAASAAHRADAFTACRRLIDELKQEVPVWKEQSLAEGGTEWL